MNRKNYYYILGLKEDATLLDIKEAFRKLSLKFHPDKNTENDNNFWSDRFIEIKEAYDTLSNENKRKEYDKQFDTRTTNMENNTDYEKDFVLSIENSIKLYNEKKRLSERYYKDLNNIYPKSKKMTTAKWITCSLIFMLLVYLIKPSFGDISNLFSNKPITTEFLTSDTELYIYTEPDVKSEKIGLFKAFNNIEFVGQTNYFYKIIFDDSSYGFVRKKEVKYNDELPFIEQDKLPVQNNDDNALIPPISEPDVVQDVNTPFEYEEGSEIGIAVDSMRESGSTQEEVKQYLLEEYKKSKNSL